VREQVGDEAAGARAGAGTVSPRFGEVDGNPSSNGWAVLG